MEDAKGQTIFLSIIGIATLLVAIIGATFAWFNVTLNDDNPDNGIVVTTASLSSITFEDGAQIDATGIFPGTTKTKTFTISQTDPSATESVSYDIKLNVISNSLSPVANGAFVNSLSGKGNSNGGTLVKVDNQVVPTESTVLGSGILVGYESHEYTYSITWNEIDEDQSEGLDKSFSGYISAVLTGISE